MSAESVGPKTIAATCKIAKRIANVVAVQGRRSQE
jgi:hypothetical protein